MLDSWLAMTMLAIESNEVVGLRLAKFYMGGEAAWEEADLMISEKVAAGLEASASLLGGASSLAVINRYRELVGANRGRLVDQANGT